MPGRFFRFAVLLQPLPGAFSHSGRGILPNKNPSKTLFCFFDSVGTGDGRFSPQTPSPEMLGACGKTGCACGGQVRAASGRKTIPTTGWPPPPPAGWASAGLWIAGGLHLPFHRPRFRPDCGAFCGKRAGLYRAGRKAAGGAEAVHTSPQAKAKTGDCRTWPLLGPLSGRLPAPPLFIHVRTRERGVEETGAGGAAAVRFKP